MTKEDLKCCGNCDNYWPETSLHCSLQLRKVSPTDKCDKWEINDELLERAE